MAKNKSNPRTMLTCLFGLRFLATLWVILGHSSIFIQVRANKNLIILDQFSHWYQMLILGTKFEFNSTISPLWKIQYQNNLSMFFSTNVAKRP